MNRSTVTIDRLQRVLRQSAWAAFKRPCSLPALTLVPRVSSCELPRSNAPFCSRPAVEENPDEIETLTECRNPRDNKNYYQISHSKTSVGRSCVDRRVHKKSGGRLLNQTDSAHGTVVFRRTISCVLFAFFVLIASESSSSRRKLLSTSITTVF